MSREDDVRDVANLFNYLREIQGIAQIPYTQLPPEDMPAVEPSPNPNADAHSAFDEETSTDTIYGDDKPIYTPAVLVNCICVSWSASPASKTVYKDAFDARYHVWQADEKGTLRIFHKNSGMSGTAAMYADGSWSRVWTSDDFPKVAAIY